MTRTRRGKNGGEKLANQNSPTTSKGSYLCLKIVSTRKSGIIVGNSRSHLDCVVMKENDTVINMKNGVKANAYIPTCLCLFIKYSAGANQRSL